LCSFYQLCIISVNTEYSDLYFVIAYYFIKKRGDGAMHMVQSSMAGNVFKVLVQPGDSIQDGADVIILESMKMEIPISAERTGIVKEVKVAEGDFVNEGDVVLELE
jgi:acetyl-CoA carboxylase biotin carboxyl carrier protein